MQENHKSKYQYGNEKKKTKNNMEFHITPKLLSGTSDLLKQNFRFTGVELPIYFPVDPWTQKTVSCSKFKQKSVIAYTES